MIFEHPKKPHSPKCKLGLFVFPHSEWPMNVLFIYLFICGGQPPPPSGPLIAHYHPLSSIVILYHEHMCVQTCNMSHDMNIIEEPNLSLGLGIEIL